MNTKQESYNSEFISDISEQCFYCGIELEHIEDIFVDESDYYCCRDCDTYYGLNARVCREIY